MAVTPIPGQNTIITVGGTAVQVFPPGINGGYITNPYSQTEELYVNPIDAATVTANGNTFALEPGQTWNAIPGQSTPTTANAVSNGHAFSAVSW